MRVTTALLILLHTLRQTVGKKIREQKWALFTSFVAISVCTCAIALLGAGMHSIILIYLITLSILEFWYGRNVFAFGVMVAFLEYGLMVALPTHHLGELLPLLMAVLAVIIVGSLLLFRILRTISDTISKHAELSQQAIYEQALTLEQLVREQRMVEERLTTVTNVAIDSLQRTRILYDLSQLIVSKQQPRELLDALTQRVLDVFSDSGVRACALMLADVGSYIPSTKSTAASPACPLEPLRIGFKQQEDNPRQREFEGMASHALLRGDAVATLVGTGTGQMEDTYQVVYVPLRADHHIVGVLGLVGEPGITKLIHYQEDSVGDRGELSLTRRKSAQLFQIFCEQIAYGLERVYSQQRQLTDMKHQLLDIIAHQMLSPVTSIRATAEHLLDHRGTRDEVAGRGRLQTLVGQVDQLLRRVRNLMTLGLLESQDCPLRLAWCAIEEVIQSALDTDSIASTIPPERIVRRISANLPLILADFDLLVEVLVNLIANAARYSSDETPITITAHADEHQRRLTIQVSDQGIGIPPGEIPLVFRRFYRVDLSYADTLRCSETISLGRNGLGLAICEMIIQAHSGQIGVESEVGRGSTFTFYLPFPPAGVDPNDDLLDLDAANPLLSESR